ncbi:28S ribosomal protein S14, mitochondrial [Nasonia vitripennis]|uniref:28S ribosomal protein S14, mitochondrial n=1 Tax=Nasonia vitripennis TaxID=7425 RepID=A0A7M7G8N5_NASVI|nr:28S ribosomal protein S14, mitochondrial [Nasonia vitripennis]
MALFNSAKSVLSKLLCTGPTITQYGLQQVRTKWTKKMTKRDMGRRAQVKQYAKDRLHYVAMKRNNILPTEIQELASEAFDFKNIPRTSSLRALTPRCVVTSRGYGTVIRWRLSRFIFRHLVDYNKMAGVQRAIW